MSASGTPDINRIRQSAEFQRLVDRLWEKWEGRRVTLDSRGRPNRLVFTNFLARAVQVAYEAGVPDPYKDVDWETIIDPELNQAENLAIIEHQLGARAGRPRAPGETDEGMLRSQIESLERELEELNFEIEYGETTSGERLTPEQIENARRRRAELEAQLEELRRRLERLERERITAWMPREAVPPAPSARPAEGRAQPPERRAPRPAPQPAPLTAFQPAPPAAPQPTPPPAPPPAPQPQPAPAPESERQRLWELFSVTLAAAGIDPTQYREDFEAEYRLVANRPYEEKLSDIMRFASEIVRTHRPRPAPAPAATAELQQVLQGLRDVLDRLNSTLSARPPTPQELLVAMGSELATVQPDRAVIQTYVSEHNCWAWVPNRHAEGLMRRYGLHNLIISRFFDCVEYWPSYPGACLWGAELVDDMVRKGLIVEPFASWLRALAAEIDRRYQEEGRAPCR